MRFTGFMATAAVIALSLAGCGGSSTQSSTSTTSGAAPSPVKVGLTYQPSGTVTLNWDPQTKNVTAKLQMAGFTPGSSHAMHIHQQGCGNPGDVIVPFPDVTADGGGAINTTVTGTAPLPPGLTAGTSLNIHLASGAQLGGPGQLGFTQIVCGDINGAAPTTLTMAPVGPPPQGSATLTYDPQKKTLTVETTASGLVPSSAHAEHIHLGTCTAQGAVKYPLNDLVASANGTAQVTTVVQNVDQAPPASGWYLNAHLGSSGQILQNGKPTLYFQPLICGNIGT
ncbi:MAG TPA: CHRD domain-containing protein [Mycobacterium sp.]|nr:CHRD domain-containing protein [Mycobacterium sp.]